MSINNKTTLSFAVISALGATVTAPTVSAVGLADGVYNVYVNTTPTTATTNGATAYDFGTDGAWRSSFTFGGPSPGSSGANTNSLSDNNLCVTGSDNVCRGASIGGDGHAGHWVLSVSGGTISFVSYSEDVITGTAAGNFARYGTVTGTGTISPTGDITIAPTGRLGAIDGNNTLYDRRWNVTPSGTTWDPLTTGSAYNFANTINGAPLASLGDIDSDGLPDYSAIFVSGGATNGSDADWGPGIAFIPYFETYNVRLELLELPGGEVPIPAPVWLLASGIFSMGTLMRRKRKTN